MPAGFHFLGHTVEGPHQVTDFVGGGDFHAIVQPPARDFLSRLRQCHHRARDQFGQIQGKPGSGKKHQHGKQQQQFHVGAPHQPALPVEFEIAALAGIKLLHHLGKLLRQRHGHHDQPSIGHGCTTQNVVGILPFEAGRRRQTSDVPSRLCAFNNGQEAGTLMLASAFPSSRARANPPCRVVSCRRNSVITLEKL